MRFALGSATALCFAFMMPTTASIAQVAPTPEALEDEPEAYEPVGGRVGSFILYPEIELLLGYSDNVLALSDEEQGDGLLQLTGRVTAQSQWQRHRATASSYLRQNLYATLESENSTEAGARVDGTYDISRRSALRGFANVDFLAEDRTSIGRIDQARSPTRFSRYGVGTTYWHDFDPLMVQGELQYQLLDFQDNTSIGGDPLEQDYRDLSYYRAAVQGAYDVSPGIAALARVEVDRLDYRETDIASGFDRDSTGYKLEGGVQFELTSLIDGQVRAGILSRDVDDPTIPDPTGFSFGGSLDWRVTPLTTLNFDADRAIEEGGSPLIAGNLRSQARVSVDHELRRNILLFGSVRAARLETVGVFDEQATEYELVASGTYLLNRNLRLFVRADRYSRSTDGDWFRDFDRNRLLGGVRVVF